MTGNPELSRLGQELSARTEDVVARMMRRSAESSKTLAKVVEDSFEDVGTVSTVAVARWMAGEGEDVARQVGRESWRIFAQLASQREAALNEVTKRCLRWRDATLEVLDESAADLGLADETLTTARRMVQRSLDVTLVRMCQSFEDERRRAHEELTSREKELVFLATHDALTGLPNRVLFNRRLAAALARPGGHRVSVALVDLDDFKEVNDTLGHDVGDLLLTAVSDRFRRCVDASDTVARLGGDEFVVVINSADPFAADRPRTAPRRRRRGPGCR